MNIKKQNGFTLIELLVVIVVLSILASFAIPRYINFQRNAKAAVIENVAGVLVSAIEMTHLKYIVEGSDDNRVRVEGAVVRMRFGYPTRLGLLNAVKLHAVQSSNGNYFVKGHQNRNCSVKYIPPNRSNGLRYRVIVNTTGC